MNVQPACFQQYPYGPWLPRKLLESNIRHHVRDVEDRRQSALFSKSQVARFQREWNAFWYLEAKRALEFLIRQNHQES